MKYITNTRILYNHNFIVFLFIITLFYPFKGLINIGFYIFINDSDPNIFNKLCFIILFLFAVLTLLFTFLIPEFEGVYAQLGSELPYYTVLFVRISVIFQNNFFF